MLTFTELINMLAKEDTKEILRELGKQGKTEITYQDFIDARAEYEKVKEEYNKTLDCIDSLYENVDAEVDKIIDDLNSRLESAEKKYRETANRFYG